MTLHVLQNRNQIAGARRNLEALGVSELPPAWSRWLPSMGMRRGLKVGDWLKSWDVELTLSFLRERVSVDGSIMDMGCYCSEMLPLLHRAGFRHLVGADLNPAVSEMPYAETIDYRCENFLASSLEEDSQDAVTSISVMEHGFDQAKLLDELQRTLKPGGFYLASFDYWPEKIDTGGQRFFDMSWTLFSEEEVRGFLAAAAERGLFPVGELAFSASNRPIKCAGFKYTFAWVALQKRV